MKVFRELYLSNRFFGLMAVLVLLYGIGFAFNSIFILAQTVSALAGIVFFVDLLILFGPHFQISAIRQTPLLLNLGDEQNIYIHIVNHFQNPVHIEIIDEVPEQFQERDFSIALALKGKEKKKVNYTLRAIERGKYHFGVINLHVNSFIGLAVRRLQSGSAETISAYPSILQMKKFEYKAFARTSLFMGVKKMRRIGHSYEFDQIKNYVQGDDYRSVNWKATSRTGGNLMVNIYEDERSQQVYCLLDKSRSMKLPFNGLSLLDHSINTSLVISNIALLKQDKVGLMSFDDRKVSVLKADKQKGQLKRILESLYNQTENMYESDYERLYYTIQHKVTTRSLVFLFTNFESLYALQRVLPTIRMINHKHLLVVVFFENTEISTIANTIATDLEGIYKQTTAQKFLFEKKQMVSELNKFGIQSILTKPDELALNTVNKYLELKSRGLI